MTAGNTPLDTNERAELIRIARNSIGAALFATDVPPLRLHSPALLAKTGAFVSVYVGDELRGCVGHVFPEEALHVTVAASARAAACDDYRFRPLTGPDWSLLSIECSVLTAPQPTAVASIAPGKHGLYITRGASRGLLLPQVATRFGWTAEEFLRATCQKAGLSGEAWLDPETEILSFEAEVFRG